MIGDALGDPTLPLRVRALVASDLADEIDAAHDGGRCSCDPEAVVTEVLYAGDDLGGIYSAELRHAATCTASARLRDAPGLRRAGAGDRPVTPPDHR